MRKLRICPRCEREFYTPEEMAKSIRGAQQEAPPVDPILRAPKRPPTGSTYVTHEDQAVPSNIPDAPFMGGADPFTAPDVGPPAPGEGEPEDGYSNPEVGMTC